jgi:hypothetical protein
MIRTLLRRLCFVSLAVPLLLLAGCRHDLTQVALVIQSDLDIPAEVETMETTSVAGPFAPPANQFNATGPALPPFPLSIGFESGGQTPNFSVTVRLFKGINTGNPFLVASRTVTDIRFVPDKTMMFVLTMNRECACQGTSCPAVGNPACDNIDKPELQPFDPAVAPPSSMLSTDPGVVSTGSGGTGVEPPTRQADAF